MAARVNMYWSVGLDTYCYLHIPANISLVDFNEFTEALAIQLRGVRRTLEAQQVVLHVHTDGCWEPDSGCDMGRNEAAVAGSMTAPTTAAQREDSHD